MTENTKAPADAAIVRDLAVAESQADLVGGADLVLVPPGYTVEDLAHTRPHPRRIKRDLTLRHLGDWAAYVTEFFGPTLRVFAGDHNEPQLRAVIDDHAPGKPGWCGHAVTYRPAITDEWGAWRGAFGKRLTQGALVEFLEDHCEDVTVDMACGGKGPGAGEILMLAREFRAHTKAEFRSDVDLHSGGFSFTYDETVRGTNKAGTIEVPEQFAIRLRLWEEQRPVTINVRFRYRLKDGELSFVLSPYRLDRIMRQAWDDVHDEARKSLPAGVEFFA